jgi:hypothetical protein
MSVITVDPSSDRRWDAYVESHLDANVFHHSAYLRALSHEYGKPTIGLMHVTVAGVNGLLPLMWTRGLPFAPASLGGRRLSSLPRTPVAGPLWSDADALEELIDAAVALALGRPGVQLQLKPATTSGFESNQLACRPWRLTYVYELPRDGTEPRFGSSKKHTSLRSAVRRIEDAGVKVRRAGSREDVRRWYPMLLETLRPHAVPPRRLRFFLALWDELASRDMCRLLLAEGPRGELLGGNFNLHLGRGTVFFAFNGARKSAQHLRPNDLLHWHAIHDAAAEGFRRYELGEVATGQHGLAQFKRKFSNRQELLQRWYDPPPAERPDPGTNHPGAAKGLLEKTWQHMPLKATSLAGTQIYRWL